MSRLNNTNRRNTTLRRKQSKYGSAHCQHSHGCRVRPNSPPLPPASMSEDAHVSYLSVQLFWTGFPYGHCTEQQQLRLSQSISEGFSKTDQCNEPFSLLLTTRQLMIRRTSLGDADKRGLRANDTMDTMDTMVIWRRVYKQN